MTASRTTANTMRRTRGLDRSVNQLEPSTRGYLLILAGILLMCPVQGFQLSMVASRPTSRPFSIKSSTTFPGTKAGPLPFLGNLDVTGGLISQLAVVALKLRLQEQTDVSCDVNANSAELMFRGMVGPVTVKGKGWKSALGLSCRAIEATVEKCELDINKIISQQKLRFTKPATGRAMIALNAADFAHFITHPLMKPPAAKGETPIAFLKQGVEIDAKKGAVTFISTFRGQEWRCTLKRGASPVRRAEICVVPFAAEAEEGWEESAIALQRSLSTFFNQMVFELDGTFLTFRDMMVTGKGQSPSVMLSLNIVVRKLPSRDMAF